MYEKTLKYLVSIILIICLSVGSVAVVSADEPEVYISELRQIYAENYDAAKKILAETRFSDYNILNYNLNSKTDSFIAKSALRQLNFYEDEDFTELAILIASAIPVYAEMFKELAAYENEMDFDDDVVTEREIEFAEHMAIAEMMRDVEYLGGKTLYEFCMEYSADDEDYESLCPLAAALNKGQIAMTKVAHYYDVVRYSMSSFPESFVEEELTKMEEEYGDNPFDIYPAWTAGHWINRPPYRSSSFLGRYRCMGKNAEKRCCKQAGFRSYCR